MVASPMTAAIAMTLREYGYADAANVLARCIRISVFTLMGARLCEFDVETM